MSRLLIAAALGALTAGPASAQCWPGYPGYPVYPGPPVFVPVYPLTPAVWGAPAPKPFPPPPTPYVPRPGVGLRDEDDPPPPRPAGRLKEEPAKKDADPRDPPKLPKIKLPPLPGDPGEPDPPVKAPPAKTDPRADGSTTKERPKDDRPAVEQFVVPAAGNRAEPRAEVQVGFFNHTDREITLDVHGESVRLPSEQYVTLRLPRSFKWSEKGQKANDVAVPPDADGLEIVFRK